MARRKTSFIERRRRRIVLPFLLPAVVLYGGFMLYPAMTTFVASLTEWNGIAAPRFVGGANFARAANDQLFLGTIGNTLTFTVVGALILFPVAMFLGYVTQRIGFGRLYRFMILAPIALSVTTAALMWKFILDPNFGSLSGLMRFLGLEQLASWEWLGRKETAMLVVILVTIWHGVGMWMLFFSAAFSRVPEELKEAAMLDGAGPGQVFRYVIWPLVWEVTRTLLILWIINGLQAFAFIIALTNGGPLGATEVIGTYIYRVAFSSREFGYGAAIAIILFVGILVLTLISQRLTKREELEY